MKEWSFSELFVHRRLVFVFARYFARLNEAARRLSHRPKLHEAAQHSITAGPCQWRTHVATRTCDARASLM
jgi:hypothetical protein